MDAAEDDDIRFGLRRLLRQTERITHVIGDILNFRHLVVMREDDRMELFLEPKDFARQRFE